MAERFWPKVQKTDTCWLWTGATMRGGYGELSAGGSPQYGRGHPLHAHRVSWELAYGPIPDGLWVLHICDTPACVRPDHLFLGTHADNMADMSHKGRTSHRKLTGEEVTLMRMSYESGVSIYRLALDSGLHKKTVRLIVNRRHYKEAA